MRKWLSIISVLSLVVIILVIAGVWQFKRALQKAQIESFEFQLTSLTLHHIKFSDLSFVHKRETAQYAVHLHNVAVDWQWPSWMSPQLDTVTAEQMHIVQTPVTDVKKSSVENSSLQFSLPENWSVPDFFPASINIQSLTITLPCAAAACSFSGVVDAVKTGAANSSGVTVNLKVNPGISPHVDHPLILNAAYTVEQNLPALAIKLAIDDSLNLQLNTSLINKNEIYWLGNLKGYLSASTDSTEWWNSYLKPLGIEIAPLLNQLKNNEQNSSAQPINLETNWQLALTPLMNAPKITSVVDGVNALTGHWMLSAKIPEPLTITKFGSFTGDINFDLDITAGKLNRYTLASDISAKDFVIPDVLAARGIVADSLQLKINSAVDSAVNMNSLPVAFSGSTQGAMQTHMSGRLLLDATAKKITFEKWEITTKVKQLKLTEEIQLNNLSADIHASGYWQPNKFELALAEPNRILADISMQSAATIAQAVELSTSKLNVRGDIMQGTPVWQTLAFTTESQLKGGRFKHPQVNVKNWIWKGNAQGSLADFVINGDLGVGGSLHVKHKAKRVASELVLDWVMPDIFLRAANPFADAIKLWPPLLTLSMGKVNASGNLVFNIEKNNLTKNKVDIQLADVSGVYDTLAFQGVSSDIKLVMNEKNIDVSTNKLSVKTINKGFEFGPLSVAGKYSATWEKLMQGKLNLQYFHGSAMGGSLGTSAQQFDFSRATQRINLELKEIDLANLLKQYSPGELSGTGLLSGIVPIEISATGVRVEKGLVAATESGGRLQMTSARAKAIAKNQPSMKLVVDALNDFHYKVLASQINYDESGTLLLSIKLEGKNPALEQGRPINLHVNLEEDIPAMLASLQLSSKVSDLVKKRLQLRVQKKPEPVKEEAN